ncbi:MAG: hypothetical protein ACJ71M_15770 [Nitrososphaeraceae archaeon]
MVKDVIKNNNTLRGEGEDHQKPMHSVYNHFPLLRINLSYIPQYGQNMPSLYM